MGYVSLHNHTSTGSLLDGYQTEEELVKTVKSLGQTACVLSDHGTMRGAVKFYKECKANDIKPIIGCEFYFCPDVTIKDKRYHLLLLAMNNTGYHNLKLLDSIAYQEDHYHVRPRIDESDLRAHSEGLVCLTACMASIVNTEVGEEWLLKFKDIFGDRLFAEIQPLNLEKQQVYNGKVVELARKHGIPLVVTTDAHYSVPEDEKYHQYWTMIHKFRYDDHENYLWSEEEIRNTHLIPADIIEEAISNTQRIADMCNVTIETTGNHFPKYPAEDAVELVKTICRNNWKQMVPQGKYKEYGERFNDELRVLDKLDYLNYMLIVWDMLDYCKAHKIPTGYGRGSASGSLVGYLMGLHKIDPVKYGIEFFRFANEYRASTVDVDSDVSRRHRGEIIEYVKKKYGTVSKVATLGYTKNPEKNDIGKAAVLKAVQSLGNVEIAESGAKEPTIWTHKRALALTKQLVDSIDEILEIPTDLTREQVVLLHDVATHFLGRVVQIGCHASAVLVTPDSIENYCPVEGAKSKDSSTGELMYTRMAGYEYHTVEEMGLMKLDILGLNTLDIIDDAVKYIKETKGVDVDIDKISFDDPKVFAEYANGQTTGFFQMESRGMRKLAQDMHVSTFKDTSALVALFRPGPLGSGMAQQYVNGKNGETIEYPNEAMKKHTAETFGVLVYQEQIMKVAMDMCGWDLGKADVLRKVIGRKEVTKINEITNEFIEDAVKNGEVREVATKVAEQIKAAGNYVFNRCLSGREKIYKHNPTGRLLTIEEMYKTLNDKEWAKENNHSDLHAKYKSQGYGLGLSMIDNRLKQNKIVDIRFSGLLDVYLVKTKGGKELHCTINHKIPTTKGVKTLEMISIGDEVFIDGGYEKTKTNYNLYKEKQAVNSEIGHMGFTRRNNGNSVILKNMKYFMNSMMIPCENCGKEYNPEERFEVHHIDKNRENNKNDNLMWVCNSCHKKIHYANGRTKRFEKGRLVDTDEIVSIEYECTENCYDVEMEAPNHNFLTGSGIVVCNCHAVSYAAVSYITAYLKTYFPKEYLCAILNSKDKQEDILPYIAELKRLKIPVLPPDLSIGNRKWTIESNGIRMGLEYIKGVGKNLNTEHTETFESVIESNTKTCVIPCIKAGALDYLKLSRAVMLAKFAGTQESLKRVQQCQDKIQQYSGDPKKAKLLLQWQEKLKEAQEITLVTPEKYDEAAGEYEVLSFSFQELSKVKTGEVTSIHKIVDKNGRDMAWVTFSTPYGDFRCTVFADGWQKVSGVDVGETYKFVVNDKGVLEELQMDGKVIKVNERRYKR